MKNATMNERLFRSFSFFQGSGVSVPGLDVSTANLSSQQTLCVGTLARCVFYANTNNSNEAPPSSANGPVLCSSAIDISRDVHRGLLLVLLNAECAI